jgi:phage gpG-like protein
MASVLGMGGQHREEATPHQLIWGTNVNYAPYHQWGTRFIPARPFLGLTEHMIREIELMVLDFIEGSGNG